jgi:hypothetical protein
MALADVVDLENTLFVTSSIRLSLGHHQGGGPDPGVTPWLLVGQEY